MSSIETIVLLNTAVIITNTFFIYINTNIVRKAIDQNVNIY